MLKLSRLTPPETFQTEGISFERLSRLASLHETAPLVHRALGQTQDVPDSVHQKLKYAYLATAGMNTRNGREAMRIVSLLQHEGVKAIPLKGPIASVEILEDPGLYPSSDIDLLVRPGDLDRAASALRGDGYEPMDRSTSDSLVTHYHLVFSRPPYFVELHWNLVKRYYRIPPEFWWGESLRADFEGAEHLTLSPERYFMALCFRAMSHEFSKLKHLVLPAELINRGAIDFTKLHELSDRYGMRRLITFMLHLTHEILGAQVPEKELSATLPSYQRLKNAVLEDLFMQVRSSYRRVLYLLLLDTIWERIRVVAGRLFPPPSEIRLRYGISEQSNKIWIYYLLNPLLLPVLLLRRRRHRGA